MRNMAPSLYHHIILLSCFLLLKTGIHVESKRVPAIIVFGDSTVDAGNNNPLPTISKSNFAPYGRDLEGGKATGRFSNGRIATDFISEAFGNKPLVPAYLDSSYGIEDFATGVTFASAGTGFDNKTAAVTSVIPLWKEVEYFKDYKTRLATLLGRKAATEVIGDAVYIISIGTNDFAINYFALPDRSLHFTLEEYESFLIGIANNFIVELYRLGARKISLGGLPPIGCLPIIRTLDPAHVCIEEFNTLARKFDLKLKSLAAKLRGELQGSKVVFSNIYYQAMDVIQKPSLYGFENVKNGCCGSGRIEVSYLCHRSNPLTCKDASKYAFWDSVHPSEKLHFIVANNMMKTSLAEFV
ncbi:GDSL esterase/lipase At4g26790-like [Papaver somniferum]|uniref:GDSL esterase/lipase At4g26790-like n=1 Tax=Papaver somniferum TaxID=3469 RepID=UPI000E70588D|nr:GDSL esterase/lipase At4g26790-like [Papaver somniferum]